MTSSLHTNQYLAAQLPVLAHTSTIQTANLHLDLQASGSFPSFLSFYLLLIPRSIIIIIPFQTSAALLPFSFSIPHSPGKKPHSWLTQINQEQIS